MLCERVIRNLGDGTAAERRQQTLDYLDVQWNECGRVLKNQSRAGRTVRVLLPPGQTVRHNDVVYEDDATAIAVCVTPCEVILADVPDTRQMCLLALELGNLHLPVQLENERIAFTEDAVAMAVLETMQIRWRREVMRFEPAVVMSAPTVEVAPQLRVTAFTPSHCQRLGWVRGQSRLPQL